MNEYGFGMASGRIICGTTDKHKELERRIASFHKVDDALIYPTGFASNAGFFEAVLGTEDVIVADESSHASIQDGVKLGKARSIKYKHLDMDELELRLQETQECRLRVIATDGVFSMSGSIAPLNRIYELAKQYRAYTFIDDSHATGVLGAKGGGTPELFGLEGKIDVISSTLSKALGGGTGGYTAASNEVINVLRNKGRPYVFSNSIIPSVLGASIEAFNMLEESTEMLE